MGSPLFAITIDTEEDNWGEYTRPSYTVENLRRIPRLQELFERRGVRPTYLISYPVATSPLGVDVLGPYQQRGACEIGTHPHPWNTPPIDEDRTPYTSFICNLPDDLQRRKITTLTDVITRQFGVRPTSYRSGRWGFSTSVARTLIDLGYLVDTSLYPGWNWGPEGPDFTAESTRPFVYRSSAGELLEVPASTGFVQTENQAVGRAYARLRAAPGGGRVLGVLHRLRALNYVCVSPETNGLRDMTRFATALLRRGAPVINFFFHSPTLLEGMTPFTRTPGDVEAFVERIDRFIEFAHQAGLQPVTMSQLSAENVRASASPSRAA